MTRQAMASQATDLDELRRVAVLAAQAAGSVIQARFGSLLTISHKGRLDLVTDVDRAAEAAAISVIRQHRPDHAILAEESGQLGESEKLWILDPLDGTTNFVHAVPHLCVSLAFRQREATLIGVILDPLHNELFVAIQGQGASLNGQKIATSQKSELQQALLGTGFPYWLQDRPQAVLNLFSAFAMQAQGMRRMGSAALDLAWVSCGRFDGFFELGLKAWDIAAGDLLVREAGGEVSGVDGQPLDFAQGDICAAGKPLHGLLIETALASTKNGSSPDNHGGGDLARHER